LRGCRSTRQAAQAVVRAERPPYCVNVLSKLTGFDLKCGCEGPHSGCAPSFASTDALPERGGNPFLIGTCKPQGSRG